MARFRILTPLTYVNEDGGAIQYGPDHVGKVIELPEGELLSDLLENGVLEAIEETPEVEQADNHVLLTPATEEAVVVDGPVEPAAEPVTSVGDSEPVTENQVTSNESPQVTVDAVEPTGTETPAAPEPTETADTRRDRRSGNRGKAASDGGES